MGVRGGKVRGQGLLEKTINFRTERQAHELGYSPGFEPSTHLIIKHHKI